MEEFGDGRIDRRRPADAPLDPAAQRRLDLAEDQFGGQGVLEAESEGDGLLFELQVADLLPHGAGPSEDFQRRPAFGFGAADDL